MKHTLKYLSLAFVFCFISSNLFSQRDEQGRERTESPYFEVPGKRGDIERLPLLSTNALVNIAGVIADVKVTQVYVNRGKDPIEANYIFPLSTRAAVYAMQFTLGKRIIKAEIQEKQKALDMYNTAKSEGKTTALVQQQRPNVFSMNLANIMPGDTIKVDLFYTELIQSEDGVYEFVYPTVVGPRYTEDPLSSDVTVSKEKWTANPYTEEKKSPTYLFDIKTRLNAGVPVQDVTCSSHEVDINFTGSTIAQVDLKSSDKLRGNKDFILKYRLTGTKIQNGMLCYEGEKDLSAGGSAQAENYFLMMMQPPKVVTEKDLPGREYIFIMDVSGSQSGFPIEISKVLMKNLLTDLRPQDKFNVLVFEGCAGFMAEQSMTASKENIEKAVAYVQRQNAGGGTNMLSALKKAMTFPRTENYSRTFAISTDGYVSIEKDAFEYIKQNLGDANFFAFGIGTSVNRYIVEGIAHAGMGEPFVVTNQSEAGPVAEKFKKYISNPVLTNIKVSYDGFNAYDIVPMNVPDVFAQRPIIIFGKYKGKPSGNINVSGITAAGKFSSTVNVGNEKALKENSALKYLWARQKIREYDFAGKIGNEVKKEITKLGLEYNLLTEYTSFVAIDNQIRNKTGKLDSVAQPLPLPEGVTNLALGANGTAGNVKNNSNSFGFTDGSSTVQPSGGTQTYYYSSPKSSKYVVHTNNSAGVPSTLYQTDLSTKSGGKGKDKKSVGEKDDKTKSPVKEESESVNEVTTVISGDTTELERGVVDVEDHRKIKTAKVADTTKKAEQIYEMVDVMPEFPGGQTAMMKFFSDKIKYPAEAKKQGLQGKVYLSFIIDKDGNVKDVKVLKGVSKLLDDEAVRVAKLMPKWTAGKMGGKSVNVRFNLPVKFAL